MNRDNQIQYLTHDKIDKRKWDHCIDKSTNGLIYAYSFYLDFMAGNWHALVLNDYEAVMPVTWRRKWFINYLYQPAFTQQLGIFSPSKITAALVNSFLLKANQYFHFAEINLNTENKNVDCLQKTNFILPLNSLYGVIYAGYKQNAVKNLRRSQKLNLQYKSMDDVHSAVELFKDSYSKKIKSSQSIDYTNFERLCCYAQSNHELVLRKILDANGTLLAIALLLQKKNRLYLLQSTTLPEGRKKAANYFLLDNVIKEYCNKDMILDFEGSEIEGIAYFYENFGAGRESYYFYRYNKLPWPYSLFK